MVPSVDLVSTEASRDEEQLWYLNQEWCLKLHSFRKEVVRNIPSRTSDSRDVARWNEAISRACT